jgi:hypothetical protein
VPVSRERSAFISDRTLTVIEAAINKDADAVGDAVADVGEKYGHSGVYAMCVGLAEAVRRAQMPEAKVGDGTLSGDQMFAVMLDGTPESPREVGIVWAAQFIAAYINGDKVQTTALFAAHLDDQVQAFENISALIDAAGGACRKRFREGGTLDAQPKD